MKKRIVLIGMMGSGKSTIGKILAKILKFEYIDSDKIIEKKCKMKIKTIFEKYGEYFFRMEEQKIILDILLNNKKSYVLALGGGAFLNKKLQKIIIKKTIPIWLDTSQKLIYERCKKFKNRPLLKSRNNEDLKNIIKALLKERNPEYSKAQFVVKTNDKPIKVCNKILKLLD